jgi:hypothetical protein
LIVDGSAFKSFSKTLILVNQFVANIGYSYEPLTMNQLNSRRGFIKTASIGALGAISIPQIVSAAMAAQPIARKVGIAKGDIILFQGDSITDSGRSKVMVTL